MKNELIGRKALIESFRAMNNTGADCVPVSIVIEAIEEAPTVDAEPVRHGRWVKDKNGDTYCSHCDTYIPVVWGEEIEETDHCPNCGAKMGGWDVTD